MATQILSVTLDQAVYNPGDLMTATVIYIPASPPVVTATIGSSSATSSENVDSTALSGITVTDPASRTWTPLLMTGATSGLPSGTGAGVYQKANGDGTWTAKFTAAA